MLIEMSITGYEKNVPRARLYLLVCICIFLNLTKSYERWTQGTKIIKLTFVGPPRNWSMNDEENKCEEKSRAKFYSFWKQYSMFATHQSIIIMEANSILSPLLRGEGKKSKHIK